MGSIVPYHAAMSLHAAVRIVIVLSIALLATAGRAADAPRPNILFIFADDHAYQAVGAYGSLVNETPSIDRLAAEGMLFRDCFVTNSICGPSRAVILTGKYSHINGFRRNGQTFDGSQQTFPKLLRQGGVRDGDRRQMAPGKRSDGVRLLEHPHWAGALLQPPDDRQRSRRVKHTGYTTDIITDLALGWLQDAAGRRTGRSC